MIAAKRPDIRRMDVSRERCCWASNEARDSPAIVTVRLRQIQHLPIGSETAPEPVRTAMTIFVRVELMGNSFFELNLTFIRLPFHCTRSKAYFP
jgi:hypothetical protein